MVQETAIKLYPLINKAMKRIIFSIYLCGFLVSSTCAQRKIEYIPADTLLQWFKTYSPLEVLDKISDSRKEMDYKTYYHISELKPYFLKWLDRDLYYEDRLKEIQQDTMFKNEDDSIYMNNKIKAYLIYKKSRLSLDSVLNTPLLYISYKDSIVDEIVKRKVARYEKKGKPFPSNSAIYHHARLKYPESYNLIYQFWKETGGGGEKNDYFSALIRMGDPEARKIYDDFIQEIVKKNGETNTLSFSLSSGGSSYYVAKQIELLSVNKKLSPFSDETFIPFNCEVIKELVSDFFYYKIKVDTVIKYRDPCDKHFEHLEEVKEAAQRLIKYYEKEEYYWMKNMPFYKK